MSIDSLKQAGPTQDGAIEYRASPEQLRKFEMLKTLATSFAAANIRYSILGGYGLDALYGKLTRDHDDIDMVVDEADYERAREILGSHNFVHDPERQGDAEKYVHLATATKLDFASTERMARIAPQHMESGAKFDINLFIPQQANAVLEGVPLCVASLGGQRIIRTIQTKRHGRREPKDVADEELVERIARNNAEK